MQQRITRQCGHSDLIEVSIYYVNVRDLPDVIRQLAEQDCFKCFEPIREAGQRYVDAAEADENRRLGMRGYWGY